MKELGQIRHDWTLAEINAIMNQPFNDLMFQAQTVHRMHFEPNEIQVSTLVNIKSGVARKIVLIVHKVRVMTRVWKSKK